MQDKNNGRILGIRLHFTLNFINVFSDPFISVEPKPVTKDKS